MLNNKQQKFIVDKTRSFVEDYLSNNKIDYDSKEIGHKHGERIESSIVENFTLLNGFTEPTASREFGDLYFTHDVMEAINVKFGYQKDGHANLCALNRLIRAVTGKNPRYPNKEHQIFDSYWILSINLLDESGNFDVHLFDVYQNLDVVSYDAGPGQLMIKERLLYSDDYTIVNNGGANMTKLKAELLSMFRLGRQKKIEHLNTILENAEELLAV
tara:strand:- start:1247 stop:1891 length:645 start_codon:yes stop_codon:yes gene_type:complete